MESRWYLFPGQTYENTKISDRAHALHVTSSEWGKITQHMDRKRRIQEAIDRERAHKDALREGSRAMTKSWTNSIENLRLRKEEERRDRIAKKNVDKIQMFYKMRAEQEVVRKAYVDKMRKEVFRSSGYPKELTSALILSETLHERTIQQDLNDKIKAHELEQKKQHDEEILAADSLQRQEDVEAKQKRLEEERKIALVLKEQIKENEEQRKITNRAHVARETLDRINAAKEEELMKQFELEEKLRKRREMALERKKAMEAEYIRQQELKKEEAEMEKATELYSEAKLRIDCMMKSKEKKSREDAVKAREALASKVAAIQADKTAADEERLAKALAEAEKQDEAKARKKAEIKAQATRDRIKDRRQFLERLQKEKRAEAEMKKWEMLNRCKTEEVTRDYNLQVKREKWAKIVQYRNELLEQIADVKEVMRQEKEIDEIMSRVSFEEADKMFFEYADEVLQLAKNRNRATFPIERVILEYKKTNNLLPKERRCRCCRK